MAILSMIMFHPRWAFIITQVQKKHYSKHVKQKLSNKDPVTEKAQNETPRIATATLRVAASGPLSATTAGLGALRGSFLKKGRLGGLGL